MSFVLLKIIDLTIGLRITQGRGSRGHGHHPARRTDRLTAAAAAPSAKTRCFGGVLF
jgi:hypothetical protein